jgi:hypothetical protein
MGAAERWPAGFRIRFEIFLVGARRWSATNARAKKQNALSLSHGFGDGSDIVHLA